MAKSIYLTATLLTLLLTLPAVARGEKLLRWRFESGQKLTVRFTQSSHVQRTVRGESTKASLQTMMEMDWLVGAVDADGAAQITQTFRRIAVKMNTPEAKEVQYDSAAQEKPTDAGAQLQEAISPLIGAALQVTLSPRGELTSVQLSEQANKAVEKAARAGRLQSLLSADSLAKILRQSLVVLPEKAVNSGDTWTVKADVPSPVGVLHQSNAYEYQGETTEDDRVYDLIEVKSTVALDQGAEPPSKLKITAQEQSGKLLFDAAAGRFARIEIEQRMTSEKAYRDVAIELEAVGALVTTFEDQE